MKTQLWNLIGLNAKEDLLSICPKCQTGNLVFNKYYDQITENGKELHFNSYPNGIDYFFIGLLECNNPKCLQIVNIGGRIDKHFEKSGYDQYGNYYESEFDIYFPEYYSPNLRYFKISDQIPRSIINQLDLSFYHFFKDPNSSANKIRNILELILEDIKAPKKTKNKKGKFCNFKNLHDRIYHFAKKSKLIGTLMLANKYIGNEGSHIGETDRTELLQAYDNIEEILDLLYVKTRRKLLTNAENLIERKKLKI